MSVLSKITYTMKQHGRRCHLATLFEELEGIDGCDRESIRQCLHNYSNESEIFKGKVTLFAYMHQSSQGGLWRLNKRTASYRTLINEYLIFNDEATIDELYEYIESFLDTGYSGKRYLIKYLNQNYKDKISFNYLRNTVALNTKLKKLPFENFLDNLSTNKSSYVHLIRSKRNLKFPIAVPETRPGEILEKEILKEKRNLIVADVAKLRDNFTCQACGFNFEKLVVEPHIINPIIADKKETLSSDNLVTLCPNCHHIAHILIQYDLKYTDKEVLLEKLKEIYAKNNAEKTK